VFTIAETMKREIQERGIDGEKIVVIPNAVDVDRFVPREPDLDLKARLGLSGRLLLGYVSNLGRREGIDFLLRAMSKLVRERRDVGVLVVGDGPELVALRRLVDDLGLTESVKIVGHVAHDQIQRYYSIIDVFVVPRRNDHAARLVTPLKPYEAMAMARPLLVAELPALAEVIGRNERGLAFKAEDPDQLATTATTLLDNELLRRDLGAAGREWVARERTWQANGARYLEAYARVTDLGNRDA
jgi:glycosyltransferase involved in cell wall biosynthesis